MVRREDIALARVILSRGWLSREEIEKALRDLAELRRHDPHLTFSHYLGAKELLSWDGIEQARRDAARRGPDPHSRPRRRPGGEKRVRRVSRPSRSLTGFVWAGLVGLTLCVLFLAPRAGGRSGEKIRTFPGRFHFPPTRRRERYGGSADRVRRVTPRTGSGKRK